MTTIDVFTMDRAWQDAVRQWLARGVPATPVLPYAPPSSLYGELTPEGVLLTQMLASTVRSIGGLPPPLPLTPTPEPATGLSLGLILLVAALMRVCRPFLRGSTPVKIVLLTCLLIVAVPFAVYAQPDTRVAPTLIGTFHSVPTVPTGLRTLCTITSDGILVRGSHYQQHSCAEWRKIVAIHVTEATTHYPGTTEHWLCYLLDPCGRGIDPSLTTTQGDREDAVLE